MNNSISSSVFGIRQGGSGLCIWVCNVDLYFWGKLLSMDMELNEVEVLELKMALQLKLLIYRSRLPCLPISCVLRIRINYCT